MSVLVLALFVFLSSCSEEGSKPPASALSNPDRPAQRATASATPPPPECSIICRLDPKDNSVGRWVTKTNPCKDSSHCILDGSGYRTASEAFGGICSGGSDTTYKIGSVVGGTCDAY
jgi:hypothetical protein